MRSIVLAMALLLTAAGLQAQQYMFFSIPDSLIKGSIVVKRADEHQITIKDKGRATWRYKTAFTILNEKADAYSQKSITYDRFFKEPSIEANLYNAMGQKIKSLKRSDIRDESGQGGGTEISDDRVKEFGFNHKEYPYTVEFIVEQDLEGLMFLPEHYFINSDRMSVEHSSLTVSYPAAAPVRYKTYNYPGEAVRKTTDGERISLHWELHHAKAVESEPMAPPWYELTPVVALAMEQFSMAGYEGSYKNWEAFGNFVYQLKSNRDVLPEPLSQQVRQLAAAQPDTRKKVEALYRFMQQNTRYISVQLGIGGWQPFDARYVYERKYGDCKALSNYLYALLKTAGIESIYTLVKAGTGRNALKEDFPSSQFNHAILCVPMTKDTMWLECTSQTDAPGYLGSFTSDRPVLLVKQSGSRLVRTPRYQASDNRQVRNLRVVLDANGGTELHLKALYSGQQYDKLQQQMLNLSAVEMRRQLHENFDIGTYEVVDFNYKERQQAIPEMDEQLVLKASSYAQRTGKRLFMMPNVLSKHETRLDVDTSRQYPIQISMAYQDDDTVRIEIPVGFKPESLPAPRTITAAFGSYQAQVKQVEDRVLLYTRRMVRYGGRYAPNQYEALRSFYNDIYKADRQKLVLVAVE
jgi:hypothetical protein